MITIKVVNRSTGKPLDREDVRLWLDGHNYKDGRTEASGEVHFDVNPGNGYVRIKAKDHPKQRLEGRVVVYV